MDFEKYLELVTPWFDKVLAGKGIDYRRLAQLMHDRTEVFNRVPDMVRFLGELPDYDIAIYTHKKMKTDSAISLQILKDFLPIIEGIEEWTEEKLHDVLMEAIKERGMKNGTALWPLRIAIAGQQNTPGGFFEIAYLLGREETLRRLKDGIEKLS